MSLSVAATAGVPAVIVAARTAAEARASCPRRLRCMGGLLRGGGCGHAPPRGPAGGTCFPRTVRAENLPHHDRPCKGRDRQKSCGHPRRDGGGLLGWSGAHRHLERQLPPLPHRPRRGLRAAPRDRRAGPAGDQGPRGPAAADGARGPGVRRRRRGHQPVERRRAPLARRPRGRPGRLRRHARVRRPARGRVAGHRRPVRRHRRLVALRPQRAQARRPALRLQAGVAGPPAGGRGLLAGPGHRAGRRLEHLPHRRRRLRPRPVPEVHPRHAARARRLPGLPGRRVRRGHPRARAGLHLLGLLPPALRARPRAQDRLRGRLALARRPGDAGRSSTATSATRRRAPARPRTTRRWSSTSTEPVRVRRLSVGWSMLDPWTS